jgi:short subunit dehydrogenase-like uncharacterized protein
MDSEEIWVLGGTGRFGSAAARELVANGARTVLVGRDAERLTAAAAATGAARTVVAPDLESMAAAIRREHPAVVVNTVGPFARTAATIAAACLPRSSYVDLANDVTAASAVLAMHDQATAAGRTLVTGAGFGIVGTEAPVTALCAGRPAPVSVRVDSIASLALEAGPVGEALAATIVEGVPEGGRRFSRGQLVTAGLGSAVERLTLPDGDVVTTGAWPSGDLLAAHRVSGAPDVVAATTEVPTGAPIRAVLPVAALLLRIAPLRRFAVRRLARTTFSDRPMPRPHTWGHARATWSDGSTREVWLRAGDATAFTAAVTAHTALRILRGQARPGAGTPIQMTGPDLVTEAGGELLLP